MNFIGFERKMGTFCFKIQLLFRYLILQLTLLVITFATLFVTTTILIAVLNIALVNFSIIRLGTFGVLSDSFFKLFNYLHLSLYKIHGTYVQCLPKVLENFL